MLEKHAMKKAIFQIKTNARTHLAAVAIGIAVSGATSIAAACEKPLLHLTATGEVVSGSRADLIAHMSTGGQVRVGWFVGTLPHRLTHWAEPSFTSIFGGQVYVQIPTIHAQRGRVTSATGATTVEILGEKARLWYGIIGSDGKLHGRYSDDEKVKSSDVEQRWCRKA
jgi:hypothetical protein